jgi:hypothetical protein
MALNSRSVRIAAYPHHFNHNAAKPKRVHSVSVLVKALISKPRVPATYIACGVEYNYLPTDAMVLASVAP